MLSEGGVAAAVGWGGGDILNSLRRPPNDVRGEIKRAAALFTPCFLRSPAKTERRRGGKGKKRKERKTTEGERPEMRSDRPPSFAASAVSANALNYGSLEARERMRNAGREQQTGGGGGSSRGRG